jgi:hypothetical protein
MSPRFQSAIQRLEEECLFGGEDFNPDFHKLFSERQSKANDK